MKMAYCPFCMTRLREGEDCPSCAPWREDYVPKLHHLPMGMKLRERYVVGCALGEGSSGITYIGFDERLEAKVAIKEYYPVGKVSRDITASLQVSSLIGSAGAGYERGKARFLREAKIMAKLVKEPSIVSIKDYFEENNTAYIVMKFVEGVTLRELVHRDGPIPTGTLLPMLEPVFGGLAALHSKSLIHRDISPDNIMLENGDVQLLDFGCARETGGDETQTVILKHGFAPVEQYGQSGAQGTQIDVYALSATIYFCLTGVVPPSAPERLSADTLAAPTALGADLTPTQEAALLKGMNVRPEDRYQTVEALHAALYWGILEETTPQDKPDPREDDAPKTRNPETEERRAEQTRVIVTPPPKRRGALIAVLLVIAVLAAGAAVYLLRRTQTNPPEPTPTAEPEPTPTPVVTPEPTPKPTAAPGTGYMIPRAAFAGGHTLSVGDAHGRQELQALMDDENVSAVVLRSGAVIDLADGGEPFAVTKPLWVDQGATLRVSSMVISGKGKVQMDGTLDSAGLIALQGEGTKLYLNGALTPDALENLVILMDVGRNLAADEALIEAMRSRLRIVPAQTEDTVAVSTFAELKRALEEGSDAVMTVPIQMEESLRLTGNLWIGEDCTLTAARTDIRLSIADGGALINDGTVWAFMDVEGGTVYNGETGVISLREDVGRQRQMVLKDGALLVNRGTLYDRSAIGTGSRLVNLGAMFSYYTSVNGGDLVNLGRLEMPNMLEIPGRGDEASLVSLRRGGVVINAGTLTLRSNAHLDSNGWIINDGGVIEREKNAILENVGIIYNRGGVLRDMDEDGQQLSGTIIGAGRVETADASEFAPPIAWLDDQPQDAVPAADEQALREAIEASQSVRVTGEIALDALEVASPLYVSGALTVESLSIDGGRVVLLSGGSLTAGTLEMRYSDQHAELAVHENASLTVTRALTMQDASICGMGGEIHLDGAHVGILDNSGLIVRRAQALSMDGADVLIEDSIFVTPYRTVFTAQDTAFTVRECDVYMPGSVDLTRVSITVDAEGFANVRLSGESAVLRGCEIRTSDGKKNQFVADGPDITLAEGTTLDNGGYTWLGGDYLDLPLTLSADESVTIRNRGLMHVNDMTDLQKPIENSGTLYSLGNDGLWVQGNPHVIE